MKYVAGRAMPIIVKIVIVSIRSFSKPCKVMSMCIPSVVGFGLWARRV